MSENILVKNNRRSSSQISIYDYPEHLNPFYEDENHKRLRFWKMGKKDGRDGRRGSFSLVGLKEMWAFKSFRLKRKSSSIGINKTSESPPTLRRYLEPNETNYGTYDSRIRHTVGMNDETLNSNFERNVPYRSSLQDMRNPPDIERNGIGFGRNDRYRSTIQTPNRSNNSSLVPPRRYVYGGSVTPQPRNRYTDGYNENYEGMSRGSSQISVASTNPFDEDDDDVVIGKLEINENDENGNKLTPTKRYPRKKRRAPPPPIPIPKIIDEETQSASTSPSASQKQQNKENDEITNLTAEIENFVKIKSEETENNEIKTKLQESEKENNLQEKNEEIPKILINHVRNEEKQFNIVKIEQDNIEIKSNNHNYDEIDIPKTVFELKITESKEDVGSEISNDIIVDKYKIRYLALNDSISDTETVPEMRNERKITNTEQRHEHLETNGIEGGSERRRSVKEIIESINRSQSLLKVNQDQLKTNNLNEPKIKPPPRRKAETKEQNVRTIDESKREVKIHELNNNNVEENISEKIKLSNEINNNNNNSEINGKEDIFKKCIIKKEFNRETSPTSSNLDWNPVPKPKRTKNLSAELGTVGGPYNYNNDEK